MKRLLLFLQVGMLVLAMTACSKTATNNIGKYADMQVYAISEEITPKEFAEALAEKNKYNVYPVYKTLSKEKLQMVTQKIAALPDSSFTGAAYGMFDPIGESESNFVDDQISFYPESNDYLVGLETGCIWCGAALFNSHDEIDTTIFDASQYIIRSTEDVFACFPCFDCDFHAEIHFYEKNNGRLEPLCIYENFDWYLEGIHNDSTMFWFKDDLYFSGYLFSDILRFYNENEDYSSEEINTYMDTIKKYFRIRLVSNNNEKVIDYVE